MAVSGMFERPTFFSSKARKYGTLSAKNASNSPATAGSQEKSTSRGMNTLFSLSMPACTGGMSTGGNEVTTTSDLASNRSTSSTGTTRQESLSNSAQNACRDSAFFDETNTCLNDGNTCRIAARLALPSPPQP